MGGRWYELGVNGGLSFQPLKHIDDNGSRLWALDWLCGVLTHERVAISPEVKESVVIAQPEGDGEVRLLAYVVPERPGQPPAKLESYLHKTLPHYMIPSSVVFLDQLPLTSNGKTDRRTLSTSTRVKPPVTQSFVGPRNQIEGCVARILADLLHLERVGIHDNFFELGGHSLVAMQLTSRVRGSLGVDVPLQLIFRFPTIAEFSDALIQTYLERTDAQILTDEMLSLDLLSEKESPLTGDGL